MERLQDEKLCRISYSDHELAPLFEALGRTSSLQNVSLMLKSHVIFY